MKINKIKKLKNGNYKIILDDIEINTYADVYPELVENKDKILSELELEEKRFTRTLKQGEK